MTVQEFIDSLPKEEQFQVAIHLAKKCLLIWNHYARESQLSYRDSVVGLSHTVDQQLLQNTIEMVEEYLRLNDSAKLLDGKKKLLEIRGRFEDPTVALQDTDWELPDQVQKVFYAVYNLIEAALGKDRTVFGELTIYVSINQAVDALESSNTLTIDQIKSILQETKNTR